ncbi:MAG: 1-deoxy-D-xylulose-5-phosphate synthase, partial [Prevotella sp.]|nr:1-deoxy-D-xylulose-5-phosphate synthase [Prevotella sp.]
CPLEAVEVGTGRKLRDGDDVAVLTIGPIGNEIASLEGASIAHYDMRVLKPLDEKILHEVGRKFKRVVTIEDGVRNGGFGSAVLEWMSDHGYSPQITRLGLPDEFVEHGTVAELRKIVGLDRESILEKLKG